jgi:hypothetical protein
MSEHYECIMSAVPRGKIWLICAEGGFAALPDVVRHMGTWTDSRSGGVVRLKPGYRLTLARDGYVIVTGVEWGWSPEA